MSAAYVSRTAVDSALAQLLARGTGAKVVDVTQFPGGVKGTEGGYIALMDYLVNALAATLGAPASGPAR